MKTDNIPNRRTIGRISKDTKGPAGFHMEALGLWTKPDLLG